MCVVCVCAGAWVWESRELEALRSAAQGGRWWGRGGHPTGFKGILWLSYPRPVGGTLTLSAGTRLRLRKPPGSLNPQSQSVPQACHYTHKSPWGQEAPGRQLPPTQLVPGACVRQAGDCLETLGLLRAFRRVPWGGWSLGKRTQSWLC